MTNFILSLIIALTLSHEAQASRLKACAKKVIDFFLEPVIADWPQEKMIHAGLDAWIPVRPHIDRQRIMNDFVATGQLALLHEGPEKYVFKSNQYDWRIAFIHRNGQITHCDVSGGFELGKKFWIARILQRRGLLEYYFDDKYIIEADILENLF